VKRNLAFKSSPRRRSAYPYRPLQDAALPPADSRPANAHQTLARHCCPGPGRRDSPRFRSGP